MESETLYEVVEVYPDDDNRTFYRTICVRENEEDANKVIAALVQTSVGDEVYDIIVR